MACFGNSYRLLAASVTVLTDALFFSTSVTLGPSTRMIGIAVSSLLYVPVSNVCITCVVKRGSLYHVTVNAIVMLCSYHNNPSALATPLPYAGSALANWATIFS